MHDSFNKTIHLLNVMILLDLVLTCQYITQLLLYWGIKYSQNICFDQSASNARRICSYK